MQEKLFQGDTVDSRRILYTPSVFARESLLYLQETGSLKANKIHESRRTNLDSYLLFLIESGSGTVTSDNITREVHAGDIVFLDCHHPYAQSTSSDLWSLSWAHFNGASMPGIYAKFLERSSSFVFHPLNKSAYSTCFARLFAAAGSDDYVRDMKINEILAELLTSTMRDCWREGRGTTLSAKTQSLSEVAGWIEQHYMEPLSLGQLSEQFFINKYYLERIFHEQYGMTVNSYLMQVRITNAKRLLRFSDLSLSEIGHQVGIHDNSYFTKVFRKVEGITPKEFRNAWQGKN